MVHATPLRCPEKGVGQSLSQQQQQIHATTIDPVHGLINLGITPTVSPGSLQHQNDNVGHTQGSKQAAASAYDQLQNGQDGQR